MASDIESESLQSIEDVLEAEFTEDPDIAAEAEDIADIDLELPESDESLAAISQEDASAAVEASPDSEEDLELDIDLSDPESLEEMLSEDIVESAPELSTDDLDIPSFGEETSAEVDDFDSALEEFDQELQESPTQEIVEEELAEELLAEEQAENTSEELDDLPSLADVDSITDIDDSELEKALDSYDEAHAELQIDEEFSEATAAATSEELEDVPGLDDWLTDETDEQDKELLEELENSSFDEILEKIDDDEESVTEAQDSLLDNPDLDLEALLTEDDSVDDIDVELAEQEAELPQEDFVDVETLLSESVEAESDEEDEKALNLDVSLGEFSGVTSDEDVVDVDSDAGIGAKLDLARAYIELDDPHSAKSLLQEVIEKGEPEQQMEAQELLDNIS